MFKKNTWIAVLLVAMVIMFVSCIEAEVEDDNPVVEIFRLSKVIADVEDGLLDGDEAFNAVFAGTPIMKCGPLNFSIITDKGVKKLKLDGMTQSWGEGLDLYNAAGTGDAKNSGVGFRAGDKITIKGSADPVGIYLNAKGGSHGATDNWQSDSVEFDHTLTLDAAIVGTIRTGSPQVIRIHYHDGKGDSRKGTIIFEEIVVTGKRGGTEDVFIDDFEVSGFIQEQGWVEGIKATPKKGKTDGAITYWYRDEDAATTDPWTKDLADVQTIGTYDVKFDVAATKSFNAASFDGYKMRVLLVAPTPVDDTDPMSNIAVVGTSHTLLSKGFALIYNGINATQVASGMPLPVQSFSPPGGTFTTPRIAYRFPADYKAFDVVKITYEIITTSLSSVATPPDDGSNGGTTDSSCGFDTAKFNADGTYNNRVSNPDKYFDLAKAMDNDDYVIVKGSGNTFTFTLPMSKFASVTDQPYGGFVITKNHGGTANLFKLTRVELYYK